MGNSSLPCCLHFRPALTSSLSSLSYSIHLPASFCIRLSVRPYTASSTQHFLHREFCTHPAFTHTAGFYREKLLHTASFCGHFFGREKLYTRKLLNICSIRHSTLFLSCKRRKQIQPQQQEVLMQPLHCDLQSTIEICAATTEIAAPDPGAEAKRNDVAKSPS